MLPDFPKHKKIFHKVFTDYIQHLTWKDSFLNGCRRESHYEGNKYFFADIQLTPSEVLQEEPQQYNEISGECKISKEDIISQGYEIYLNMAPKISDELKNQFELDTIQKIKGITDKTGQILDTQGKKLTWEQFLNAMPITFDRQGQVKKPTLLIHPNHWSSFQSEMLAWQSAPDFEEVHDRIIERKRQEWNDRQSYRKLVD